MTRTIQWTAEQSCGECGTGVFENRAGAAVCTDCQHEHAMDPSHLDDLEEFAWLDAAGRTTLHVIAYEISTTMHKMSADTRHIRVVPVCDAEWSDHDDISVSWASVDCPDCLARKPS